MWRHVGVCEDQRRQSDVGDPPLTCCCQYKLGMFPGVSAVSHRVHAGSEELQLLAADVQHVTPSTFFELWKSEAAPQWTLCLTGDSSPLVELYFQ